VSRTAHFSPLTFSLLLLCFSFFAQLWTADATQIVFDDIGEMAGAVSYVHVVVPIELRTTAANAIALRKLLDARLKDQIQRVRQPGNKTRIQTANDLARLRITITELEETDHIFDRLRTLRQYFPHDFASLTFPDRSTFNASSVPDPSKLDQWNLGNFGHFGRWSSSRQARFLPLVSGAVRIGTSIFSTINGLYTRGQLKQIRKELTHINQEQRRIIQLTSVNAVAISLLDTKLADTASATADTLLNSPAVDHAEVDRITKGLHRALDLLVQAIQEAQKSKLASEFLRPDVLEVTFADVSVAAAESHCKMVIENAADLALVEVSYLADKDGSVLIMHVPIVPANTLLRLLRLHPFPIPLDHSNSSLLPEVNIDVIGLSDNGYSTEIRYSDLVECHKIGRTYYCEKQGILGYKLPSCLRALHDKSFDLALQLCELKVVPQTEAVTRISNNRYLVFSPTSLAATRHCAVSALGATIDIPTGISKIDIPNGCWVELQKHHVYADSSVNVNSHQFSYQWDWGSTISQLQRHPELMQPLADALTHRVGPLHLHDILEQAESIHLDLVRSQDLNDTFSGLNSTLSSSFSASAQSRKLNSILSAVAMAFGLFAVLALIFAGFYFRLRLRRFVKAVRHIFSKMPDLKQLLLGNNNTSETAPSDARLYPNLQMTVLEELAQFSQLIRDQSVRLRRPRAPIDVDHV